MENSQLMLKQQLADYF